MRTVGIIGKKRDGGRLSQAECSFFASGLMNGKFSPSQAGALCMAVYFHGLDLDEIQAMVGGLIENGRTMDPGGLARPVAGFITIGAADDKIALLLPPLLAACGIAGVCVSGLGQTGPGGTLDKLKDILGMRTDLGIGDYLAQLDRLGSAIVDAGTLIPPASRLWAVQTDTSTGASWPLAAAIAAAEALATGAGTVVFQIKTGPGSLWESPRDGAELASLLRSLGKAAGRRFSARLTPAAKPPGQAVGALREFHEVLAVLRGREPEDLRRLAVELAVEALMHSDRARSRGEAEYRAHRALDSGRALAKFREMIAAQGGDAGVVDDPDRLPNAKAMMYVTAKAEGYLADIDPRRLENAVRILGAGQKAGRSPDPAAGLRLLIGIGQKADPGTSLAELYTNCLAEIEPAQKEFLASLSWSSTPVAPVPLFLDAPGGIATE